MNMLDSMTCLLFLAEKAPINEVESEGRNWDSFPQKDVNSYNGAKDPIQPTYIYMIDH